MIVTMAYLLLIAALLGLAAHVAERICQALAWPRRRAWMTALAASLALPALMLLADSASPPGVNPVVSLPPLLDQLPGIGGGAAPGPIDAAEPLPPAVSFDWPDWQVFDPALTALWIGSSAALLLLYALAAWQLGRFTRRAERRTIDGETVLLSDRLGPAVLGLVEPRIVLPQWLAEQESALRAQVLRHEREHIAAGDQRSLLAALLLVASMPWNPALWWQLKRLRAAIEFDCDQRVLRAGADPRDYSRALLTVGRRAARVPFAALALTEPASELERRIGTMLGAARSYGAAGIAAGGLIVAALIGAACSVNAPDRPPSAPLPVRPEIQAQLSASLSCLDRQDLACAREVLDETRDRFELTVAETAELQSMYAAISTMQGDTASAIAATEAILELPSEQAAPRQEQALRGLMNTHARNGRYAEALEAYRRMLALPAYTPNEQDYYSGATLHYRLGNLEAVVAETDKIIALVERPREAVYEVRYAAQSELGDAAGAARTLAILTERWPGTPRASAQEALAQAQSRIGDLYRGGVFRVTGDYLPVARPDPIYPVRPLARRIEGYVELRFTVTASGDTADVQVVDASSSLFERSAVDAVTQFKYEPREVDGVAVEVPEVTARIEYLIPGDG